MNYPEVDELRMLRERAYGPGADIHSDSKALQRLRELEDGGSVQEPAVAIAPDAETSRIELSLTDQETERLSSISDRPDSLRTERPWIRFRPRRSTVLIVLAAALVVAAAIVTLAFAQRVQADPLQVGASQSARLSVDPGFDTPAVFGFDRAGGLLAFQDFYGVRTVVQEASDPGSNDECMSVYQPEFMSEVSDGGYSYSGRLYLTSCSAGPFPAAVAFTVLDDFPESLRDAYPVGTSFQFVYDEINEEIVVFQG